MTGRRFLSAAGVGALAFVAGLATTIAADKGGRDDLSADDAARVAAVIRPTTDFSTAERFEARSAGAGTHMKRVTRMAFSQPLANLSRKDETEFRFGNGLFEKLWVSSPSSTRASDGLGPLFNARSCQSCHVRDGRGRPPEAPGASAVSMFLRLSVPPETDADRKALATKAVLSVPEPTYGGQLQESAVTGLAAEGQLHVDYTEETVVLAGGDTVRLRRPHYRVTNLGYGPMHPKVQLSPRVAPQMVGLGLIEQIHEADILRLADPMDADGDGISGKASMVRDHDGTLVLGRFGWKASMPSVLEQSAHAFSGDIGISNPLMPDAFGDCTARQPDCRGMPTGEQANLGATEAPDPVLAMVVHYSENVAVPARRDVGDAAVLRGKKAFYGAGCASCHTPKFVTRRDAPNPAHRFQLIWPYSDFLLHDMGEGLADRRPVGDASGRDWRTPPLWGIGLTKTVSGHTYFLHDGRARTLLEAILWHGGEAEASRDAVVDLPPSARADLLKFLGSL
ncbi:CxxC motif-containing protein (DUF1111 family) [Rhodobium orientis]|nr:CxxC motif-containing protein (DUF1111 family) [Rhodobium orientis]